MKISGNLFKIIISLLSISIIPGCEKEVGKIHLKVINQINAETEIVVRDSKTQIPADGNFHEVTGYLEAEYKLFNVVWDSVTNWTPQCILERTWKTNRTISAYFGDFEKLPVENYYTLILKYKIEYSDPVEYSWLESWYNIVFTYSDNSTLTSSRVP